MKIIFRKFKTLLRLIKEFIFYIIRSTINNIKLKNNPKVSIIMPVYNCKDYINEAIDSLLNQSLKDIEIICIDDTSTDGTYEILKEYSKKDVRIKLLRQKHSNAGNARNKGIKHSKGNYLLFLDSDDFFEKDLCKASYKKAITYNADIVLFKASCYDNQTHETWMHKASYNKELMPKGLFNPVDIKDTIYQISNAVPWTKLVKASFVKENNLVYQSLHNANDVYFMRTAFSKAKRMIALNKSLVYYRVNHGINTQANKYKSPLCFLEALVKVREYLTKNNLYHLYRNSFRNMSITNLVYNYESNIEEAKQIIKDRLFNGGLDELDLTDIKKEEVYKDVKFEEYLEIIK